MLWQAVSSIRIIASTIRFPTFPPNFIWFTESSFHVSPAGDPPADVVFFRYPSRVAAMNAHLASAPP
jgi:hypothetical protein